MINKKNFYFYLCIIFEKWKILVLIPLAVGGLVGLFNVFAAKNLEVNTVVRLTESEVSVLRNESSLEEIIVRAGLNKEDGVEKGEIIKELKNSILYDVNNQLGTVAITIRTKEAEVARRIALATVETLFDKIIEKKLNNIKELIIINEYAIKENKKILLNLQNIQKDGYFEMLKGKMMFENVEKIEVLSKENLKLKNEQLSLADNYYISKPGHIAKIVGPNLLVVVILSVVVTFIGVLLIVSMVAHVKNLFLHYEHSQNKIFNG
jgi:hypothetical protein